MLKFAVDYEICNFYLTKVFFGSINWLKINVTTDTYVVNNVHSSDRNFDKILAVEFLFWCCQTNQMNASSTKWSERFYFSFSFKIKVREIMS